jgi:hypothetical protein
MIPCRVSPSSAPSTFRRSPTQSSRCSSGPSRNWVKTKRSGWKRLNAERWRIFESPRKPEVTEAQSTLARKRQQLAKVLERLGSPGLSQDLARELEAAGRLGARDYRVGAGLSHFAAANACMQLAKPLMPPVSP